MMMRLVLVNLASVTSPAARNIWPKEQAPKAIWIKGLKVTFRLKTRKMRMVTPTVNGSGQLWTIQRLALIHVGLLDIDHNLKTHFNMLGDRKVQHRHFPGCLTKKEHTHRMIHILEERRWVVKIQTLPHTTSK